MITIVRGIQKYKEYSNEPVDRTFDVVLKAHDFSPSFHAKETRGDGNCFYRSISYILFAREDDYYILKLCCIFILYEYETYFKENLDWVYESAVSFEKYSVNICREKEWAGEVAVIATTILLNRQIISYSCDEKTKTPSSLEYSHDINNIAPILIAYHRHHYVPILQAGIANLPFPKKQHSILPHDCLKIHLY